VSNIPRSLERAYSCCLRVATDHYENFPVSTKLLPSQLRLHIAAVYAFARYADDFADEFDRSQHERLNLLDDWLKRLHCSIGRGVSDEIRHEYDLVFAALSNTIDVCELPVSLFEDLLSAFRQDVTVHRYRTWNDLLDYCRRSANPIGRIVLRIAGYNNSELERAADKICSALQITNFLQDFRNDWQRGRLYIPEEILRANGAYEQDLDGISLPLQWRRSLAEVAKRTRNLFEDGRVVCDFVHGRLKFELRLTWLGGMCVLEQLERIEYDSVIKRPTVSASDYAQIFFKAVVWRASQR